jgi:glycosyltransferase involved in cell wall biosynthesis
MANQTDWQTISMTQTDDPVIPVDLNPDPVRRESKSAPASMAEIDRAISILNQVTSSSDPAGDVADNLDQIDRLLPALLEVNIRQARADGRLDLAVALQEMKSQIDAQRAIKVSDGSDHPAANDLKRQTVLLMPSNQRTRRMTVIQAALQRAGWRVDSSSSGAKAGPVDTDLVIACDPHLDAAVLKKMAVYSAQGIPVVVDLGDDFEHLPMRHPDYESRGLGTHANARAFTSALLMADHITVPSFGLANALCATQAPVSVIPDGWDSSNPLWTKHFPKRNTINIGWIGNPGGIEDLFTIRRIIIRVLREFPETQLVIVGNTQAFQLFDTLPQNRKLFLPQVSPEEYPYIFSQIDILLVPLGNQPFYLSQSDQVLVEAGARRIPWIASPLPAVTSWKQGGALATSPEEWHSYLRQLIVDENLRHWMGETGQQLAHTREASQLMVKWQALLEHLRMQGPLSPEQLRTE